MSPTNKSWAEDADIISDFVASKVVGPEEYAEFDSLLGLPPRTKRSQTMHDKNGPTNEES